MLNCEHCRSLMLDYLYDLLEGDERQAWEAHLQDCSACQAELERAKVQRQLLAKAAKMEFASVHFTPPGVEANLSSAPAATETVRLQRPARPRRWRQLLVAAALLVGFALAGAVGWYGRDYRQTELTIAHAENRIKERENVRVDRKLSMLGFSRKSHTDCGSAARDGEIENVSSKDGTQVTSRVTPPAGRIDLSLGAPTATLRRSLTSP